MDDSDSDQIEDECMEENDMDPLQPKVNNIVANAMINIQRATGLKKLDFSVLAHKMDDVVYNGKECTTLRFVIEVLHHPKKMGGIFHSNGKINICGGLSVLMCREGIKKFAKRLGVALGVKQLCISNFTVTNVVATMKLPRPINVRMFKSRHKDKAELNSSRPCIKYKCEEPHFTAMLFATGKVNLMGCRSADDLPAISDKVQELTNGCLRV